jgi:hypothetical protein
MQESTYPSGTAALPAAPSKKPIVAALVALIVGGAAATGVWWLTDNDVDLLPDPATRVIVADTPVAPIGEVAVKNEAGVAAAISGVSSAGTQYGTSQHRPVGALEQAGAAAAKDEAATAAAVGRQHGE